MIANCSYFIVLLLLQQKVGVADRMEPLLRVVRAANKNVNNKSLQ